MKTIAFFVCAFTGVGCVRGADLEIRNPLVAGVVDPSTIVKTHEPTEDQFGLPRHSLSDEARLLSVDDKKICIALTLRETDPISLRETDAKLSAPSAGPVSSIEVYESPAAVTAHQGQVPMQQQTGTTTSCVKRDDYGNCLAWDTEPTYETTFVAGSVEVHEAKGKMCFPNNGIVTQRTEQLTLEIEARRRAPRAGNENRWAAAWGARASKDVTFRWGFGAGGAPAPAPTATESTEVATTTVTVEPPPPPAPRPPPPPPAPAAQPEKPKPAKRAMRDPSTIIQERAGVWDQRDAR